MTESREILSFNSSYIEDIEYSIQVNRWLLKPIGAWPVLSTTSKREKILTLILNVLCYILIIFTLTPSILFLIFDKEANASTKLKALGPLSHWSMGGINYYFVLLKGNEIARCIEQVETDWRAAGSREVRRLMLKNAKIGRSIVCLSAFCMQLGILLYCATCALTRIVVPVGNGTMVMRILLCPVYNEVLDTTKSPMYEAFFAVQCVLTFVINSITIGVCGIAAVFAMHACGQLDIVMSWFDDIVNEGETGHKTAQNRLILIVQHHLRILSFIGGIEETMYRVSFVEIVRCTMNLCMLGYYAIAEWEEGLKHVIPYGIIFIATIYNIFIFCYIGENLTVQCSEVGQRAYMSNWYHLPPKTALCLVMIIANSNMGMKLTAGKVIQLSVATFADVVKTSFGYLNMLRTVTL